MVQTTRYAGVLAKLGAARSSLLSQNKLRLLTDAKNLSDFSSQLHETTYQLQISKILAPITSRKLERAFNENLIETYVKIIQNSPKTVKSFLALNLLRVEIENLKTLIKASNAKMSFEQKMSKVYFSAEEFLDREPIIEEAAKAEGIRGTVDALKGTEYDLELKMGLESYNRDGSTACFDVLLDKHFYDKLYESYLGLPKKEKRHAIDYVSLESDGFLLQMLLRGKNLHYDPDWLRLATPNKKFQLTDNQIEKIIVSRDFNAALKIAQESPYRKYIVRADTPEETLENIKKTFDKALFMHARAGRIKEIFNVGAVLSYFTQKQVEVRNLMTASLGVEALMKPEDIQSQLVLDLFFA